MTCTSLSLHLAEYIRSTSYRAESTRESLDLDFSLERETG